MTHIAQPVPAGPPDPAPTATPDPTATLGPDSSPRDAPQAEPDGADAARIMAWRLGLGAVGLGGIGYGLGRILQSPAAVHPQDLGEWLLAVLILHDGILAPVVTVFGVVLSRLVPGRARAYLQGALLAGTLIASFTVVEIYREGHSRPGNALLEQNYGRHLLAILAIVAVLTAALYVVRVGRDRWGARRG